MTQTELEQAVNELKAQMAKLQQERLPGIEAEIGTQKLKWTDLLTSDDYLRTERLPPQYSSDGSLVQQGGSEVIQLPAAERFEFVNPVNGIGIGTIDVTAGADSTLINVTETGLLIGIGVVISGAGASGGAANVYLNVTIDGGTTQAFQLVFSDIKWGKTIQPLVQVGATPQSGNVDGHSLYMPMGLVYGVSLEVELESSVVSSITGGAYAMTGIVYRGRLVS